VRGGEAECAADSVDFAPGGRELLDAERIIPKAIVGTDAPAAVCDLCLLRNSGRVGEVLGPIFGTDGEIALEVRLL
jgi:hypothetical protein